MRADAGRRRCRTGRCRRRRPPPVAPAPAGAAAKAVARRYSPGAAARFLRAPPPWLRVSGWRPRCWRPRSSPWSPPSPRPESADTAMARVVGNLPYTAARRSLRLRHVCRPDLGGEFTASLRPSRGASAFPRRLSKLGTLESRRVGRVPSRQVTITRPRLYTISTMTAASAINLFDKGAVAPPIGYRSMSRRRVIEHPQQRRLSSNGEGDSGIARRRRRATSDIGRSNAAGRFPRFDALEWRPRRIRWSAGVARARRGASRAL